MSNNDRVNWVAVRHDYCAGELSIAAICRQHGLTTSRLYSYRKKHTWPARKAKAASSKPVQKASPASRIDRLYRLYDRLMKETEMQPEFADPEAQRVELSSADQERSARTLSSLVRSFEKIKELEAEELSENQKQDDKELNDAEEKKVEELCEILLERFTKLSTSGNPEDNT